MIAIVFMSLAVLLGLFVSISNFKRKETWIGYYSLAMTVFCLGILGLCINEYLISQGI